MNTSAFITQDVEVLQLVKGFEKIDMAPTSNQNNNSTATSTSMQGVSHSGMHGNGGDVSWAPPVMVVECNEEARPGYTSMQAHEYLEAPGVLKKKIQYLAQLLSKSKYTAAYTGAGISTSSGIGDYASKSKHSLIKQAKKKKKGGGGFQAQPTVCHRVLVALHNQGLLQDWIQQNHDGLPQKAGLPQHKINEIHGAWYDPSNPVVPMTGTLRDDLCEKLYASAKKTDLCLAMGTSLCGMNADRMVEVCSKRCLEDQSALGSVIIGYQRTQYDEMCTLRIYAKTDVAAALLAKEMNLIVGALKLYTPIIPQANIICQDVFKIPYHKTSGKLSSKESTTWNLSPGKQIRITSGPGKGFIGTMCNQKSREGHYRISLPCQREGSKQHGKGSVIYILGSWWVQAAVNGNVEQIPFVNI